MFVKIKESIANHPYIWCFTCGFLSGIITTLIGWPTWTIIITGFIIGMTIMAIAIRFQRQGY